MARKVTGSVGSVPKRREEMRREAPKDATVPMAMPIKASCRVFRMTSSWTRASVAPSAMRMPISWVRCVTE